MWYLLIISVHYVQINFMHSYHNRLCKISINKEIMKEENVTCRIFTVNIEDKNNMNRKARWQTYKGMVSKKKKNNKDKYGIGEAL